MSSILGFAWRRRHRNSNNKKADAPSSDHHHPHQLYSREDYPHSSNSPIPPLPSVIESTTSSDASTVATTTEVNSNNKMVVAPAKAPTLAVTDILPKHPVVTPDGLKPRRSLADIRGEILATTDLLFPDSSSSREVNNEERDTTSTTGAAFFPLDKTETAIVPIQEEEKPSHQVYEMVSSETRGGVLPSWTRDTNNNHMLTVLPPNRLPSRSWSTAFSSPTPRSSSRWSFRTTPSAESPNLAPGHTKTAVGQLVALQQNPQQQPPPQQTDPPGEKQASATPSMIKKFEPTPQKKNHQLVPHYQSTTTSDGCYDTDWLYSPQEQGVESMYSPISDRNHNRHGCRDEDNDAKHNLSGILNSAHGVETVYNGGGSSNKANSKASVSTFSTNPIPPPPSPADRFNDNVSSLDDVGTEVILSPSHVGLNNSNQAESSSSSAVVLHALDSDMQRIKARNQLRAKEEMIYSIVERIQDDVQLIPEIEYLLDFGSYRTARTSLDEEGLLTDIPEHKRYEMLDKIDSLLGELDSGIRTEEFFLSPSKLCEYEEEENETHNGLRNALCFCKVLVQMAIPDDEKEVSSLQGTDAVGHWKFLHRAAIGITDPVLTPQGNSSFYSLPCDDAETPMTSNVSFSASTLTSNTQNQASPLIRTNQLRHNGLHLRQALQVFLSTMQKMTLACQNMENVNLPKITEQIKETYFQLVNTSHGDLRSMVDAFEFDMENEDSCEIDEVGTGEEEEDASPIMSMATIGSGNIDDHIVNQSLDTAPISPPRPAERSNNNIIHNNNDQENNNKNDENLFEYDDLRRQVGSMEQKDDNDDNGCEEENDEDQREGPEVVEKNGKMVKNNQKSQQQKWSTRIVM